MGTVRHWGGGKLVCRHWQRDGSSAESTCCSSSGPRFQSYLNLLSCCYIHHNQQQITEERVSLAYTSHHTSSLRKVRAGAEACIEEHCLLVCFRGLLNLLSSTAQGHIPLGVAHQSLYTRKRPTDRPTGTLDGGIFSVKVFFSHADPSLCQLDRKVTSTSFQH